MTHLRSFPPDARARTGGHVSPGSAADQAYTLLRTVFTIAPIAVRRDIGGYVVAAWLAGIMVNSVTMGEYLDVALRDFGFLVGALALTRLAHAARSSCQAPAGVEPGRA